MIIKIITLKSGDHIICKVDPEDQKGPNIKLVDPFMIFMQSSSQRTIVNLSPICFLSDSNTIEMAEDWILYTLPPSFDLLANYKKMCISYKASKSNITIEQNFSKLNGKEGQHTDN